ERVVVSHEACRHGATPAGRKSGRGHGGGARRSEYLEVCCGSAEKGHLRSGAPPQHRRLNPDSMTNPDPTSRRSFLGFLAASPFVAASGMDLGSLGALIGGARHDQSTALALLQQAAQEPSVIA